MKSKLFGFLLLIAVGGLLTGGCGETTHESSTYYSPNWMPDGRIICNKVTSKWSDSWFGRRELGDTNYIAAMSPDGSGETNLFEVSGAVEEITCSPTSEMIGWVVSGHGSEAIKLSNYQGNILYTITAPSGEVMQYFDWSPDASKIVYSTGNLNVINTDGSNNIQIATSAEAVAWRVGGQVVFEDSIINRIWVVAADGASNEVLVPPISARPQKTNDNKLVYRENGDQIKTINIDGTNKTDLFSGYGRTTLKLSFTNTRIVGGDLRDIGIVGIWVTNINDGTSTKLR